MAVLGGLASRGLAEAQGAVETPAAAELIVTSEVGGHLADPVCAGGETLRGSRFGRIASAFGGRSERGGGTPRRGAARPLVLDTGGLLTPHGISRFAAQTDPEGLARLVAELGYQARMLGVSDLSAPRALVTKTALALRKHRIPTIATNLRCARPDEGLCRALVDASDGPSLFRANSETIALIGLLDAGALAHVGVEERDGLALIAPARALKQAVPAARRAGATLVIASIDHAMAKGAAGAALEVVGGLPKQARPDLLLVAAGGDELLFARPVQVQPALAAAPPGRALQVLLRRAPEGAPGRTKRALDILARPLSPGTQPSTLIERWARELGPRYCRRWGQHLAGGRLKRPINLDGLLHITSESLRFAGNAEVALVNRGLLEPAWKPLHSRGLSRSDVYLGIRYDEPLMVATVPGSWLQRVAHIAEDSGRLHALGLTVEDGNVLVNGRPLELRGRYKVGTIQFLASGGEELLPEGPDWRSVRGASTRSALLQFLSEPRGGDPREAIRDLGMEAEWMFRSALDASFGGSSISNSPGYEQAQLQRADVMTFGLESTLLADAAADHWTAENALRVRYRMTQADREPLEEGDDLVAWSSVATWRHWRTKLRRFYVPEPFAELYGETELTVPDERTFRHLLLRPSLGSQFTLVPELRMRVSGGFEARVLEPGRKVTPGFGAQVILKPVQLLQQGDRRLEVHGRVDVFLAGPFGIRRQTLRGRLDAAIDLAGPLALAFVTDVFGFRERGQRVATALNSTVALRVRALARQGPAPGR